MKVYFYYEKNLIDLDDIVKQDITSIGVSSFRLRKDALTLYTYQCDNIVVNDKKYDYYAIIDEYEINDIANKKKQFSDKLNEVISKFAGRTTIGSVKAQAGFKPEMFSSNKTSDSNAEQEEFDYNKRSKLYVPKEPQYTFDRVILPKDIIDKINESINVLKHENKVFKEWGLNVIQPNPSSALSFFGPSGTGKTMAAEAVAHKLGKKILKVGYADIESKYHGEGPKMVKAIFKAAEDNDAVLFIDEADSLLSRRLTNVTQGSEQAINSMRSQLLICLEDFHGIVIFATNLVVNYDPAFLTRLISIEFKKPDLDSRKKIWAVHVLPTNNNGLNIPLADNVNLNELAEKYEFCGREIRKAVVSACVSAAIAEKEKVSQEDFINACQKIIAEEESIKAQFSQN